MSSQERDRNDLNVDKTFVGKSDLSPDQSLGDEVSLVRETNRKPKSTEFEATELSGRYEILSLIGQGGMGQVYLARDKGLGRQVAIKRIRTSAHVTQIQARRFLVEAQSVAKISHYNVVHVYELGQDSQGPFMVLEYVDGGTLADLLKNGKLSLERSIRMTCRLADGLRKVHELDIIHRDIKPTNILLTKDGEPKLTDFGLARDDQADTSHTVTGAVLGTLDFMPPEQRRDAKLTDARSDLWSLAATFYQMVTGKSPRIIRMNLLPPALHDFMGKALEDDPAERFQTAQEFYQSLIAIQEKPEQELIDSAELQPGECTSCHSINEVNRKFCRKCATTLRTNCLKCNSEIPVWDNICGECGANQAEIIIKREQIYDELKLQCEELIEKLEFSEASTVANELGSVDKVRFKKYIEIAKELEDRIQKSHEELLVRINDSWEKALSFVQIKEYQSSVNLMEVLPQNFLSAEMVKKLNQWKKINDEINALSSEIKIATDNKKCEGLLTKADRLIEIGGEKPQFTEMRNRIVQRNEGLSDQILKLMIDSEDREAKFDVKQRVEFLAQAELLLQQQVTERNYVRESLNGLYNPLMLFIKARQVRMDLIDAAEQIEIQNNWQQALPFVRRKEYQSAVLLLEKFSEKSLGLEKAEQYREWKRINDRILTLSTEIKLATQNRKTGGLLFKVEELIQLRCENPALAELKKQLIQRNDNMSNKILQIMKEIEESHTTDNDKMRIELLSQAKTLLQHQVNENNYSQSVYVGYKPKDLLDRVKNGIRPFEIEEDIKRHVKSLNEMNGYKDVCLIVRLINLTQDYLKLNPSHSRICNLSKTLTGTLETAINNHPDPVLNLSEFNNLPLETVAALSRFQGDLDLDGLTELSVQMAQSLAKHRGVIMLKGLNVLEVPVADALASHHGAVWLNGLKMLSFPISQIFSKYKGDIILNQSILLTHSGAEQFIRQNATSLTTGVMKIKSRR